LTDPINHTPMVRTLLTFVLCGTFAVASAQNIQDTEAMKSKAKERMERVDHSVSLTGSQKEQVEQVYLEVERYMAALEFRFKDQPKETRDGDMPGQYANMERFEQEKLATILTKEQYAVWQEAIK
jgi:hypothetical protein